MGHTDEVLCSFKKSMAMDQRMEDPLLTEKVQFYLNFGSLVIFFFFIQQGTRVLLSLLFKAEVDK